MTESEPTTTHPWIEPLRLPGGHSLPNRILPGPMEGITPGAFCRVFAAHGLARSWITPFIRISTGVPRRARLRERLDSFLETGLPTLVQIMGTNIERLAETAARLVEFPVAGIDLNCACPSPTVVRNGAGGRRLAEPSWIRDALLALRRACPKHGISVKLRSGLASPDEMVDILDAVREAAPDLIILHCRTVAEAYRPIPDRVARFRRARELVPDLPLIGSGDVFTTDAALELFREAQLDGVAPARGLLRNPWLLCDIENACRDLPSVQPPPHARQRVLLDIARDVQRQGAGGRGFLIQLARHLHPDSAWRSADLLRCQSLDAVVAELERLATDPPPASV